jgi:hypothetical protein
MLSQPMAGIADPLAHGACAVVSRSAAGTFAATGSRAAAGMIRANANHIAPPAKVSNFFIWSLPVTRRSLFPIHQHQPCQPQKSLDFRHFRL